jgi:hypothetical protein
VAPETARDVSKHLVAASNELQEAYRVMRQSSEREALRDQLHILIRLMDDVFHLLLKPIYREHKELAPEDFNEFR